MPTIERFKVHRQLINRTSDFENPSTPEVYPPDLELEPIHMDIDLFLDLINKSASGTVTTTVKARSDGPTEIRLNAVDFVDLEVSDPQGHPLVWSYDGQEIAINWFESFKSSEERLIAVTYKVVEPVDGLYFSSPNEAYPDQAWYAATDHETERARHWLPAIDLPNVRTTLDFHLRAEERFTILANGYLVNEESHDDSTKTAHWRLDQLCPSYLVCFAIGDFVRADDGLYESENQKIELAYFSSPEHTVDDLRRSFGKTRSMMNWMTKKLDMPFPYPKYYQFALPIMGGAMENISLVSWGDYFVLDEDLDQEIGWIVDVINLHEMAHSYFGDAVVIRDFAHAWLKESWATYMEQCWSEEERSEDEAQFIYLDNATLYFQEADERYRRPIVTRRFKSSWQMYDRHLYPGGACRLHTLRRELGDELFWSAVRDYLKRHNGQVVETDDFRYVLEEHSGRSLGKFFDQWFRSPGYPDLKVSFEYDAKLKQGVFEIEQTQVDMEKGIPAFVFSTDLGWTIEGKEHRLPVKIKDTKHTFVISMSVEPDQVRFDPGYKVLHKLTFNPGDPMLRRQLTEADDIIGRILAARELVKTGKRTNIEAIIAAYPIEPFWGVREEFVKALAKANSDVSLKGLVEIIQTEQDPLVLPAIFRAAGKYRDIRIRDAIGERLAGELKPTAQREAFAAMGAQRNNAQWQVLLEGSRQTGFNGLAQSGAFEGIAASRRDEATDYLIEEVVYGKHSNRVRPTITTALADIGQGLDKLKREQVVEILTDLLRDPWENVRWRAATGLKDMPAPEAIPSLEAYKSSLSKQMQVYTEKMIQSLRGEDKSDGSALKKQMEELNDKVRKLEDQLQRIEAQVNKHQSPE